jgi:hypothetical protein
VKRTRAEAKFPRPYYPELPVVVLLRVITVEDIITIAQEVGNQTTRRREGGVGRWLLAVRLEKRHPFSRLLQRRDRQFPSIEHPTDNSRAVIGIFISPRVGGSI